MHLTDQQLWTLDKLGIPVWQLRENLQPEPIAEPAASQEAILETIEPLQVVINSDTDLLVCCPATQDQAEQQLLANISKAINGQGVIFEQHDVKVLSQMSAANHFSAHILILGEMPSELAPHLQDRCTPLPSLSDLLAKPSCKAELWAAICLLNNKAG